jgi:hypothetical protein
VVWLSPNTQRRPLADTSKAATEGQVGRLVEESSTSFAKKLGQQQGFITVEACTTEAYIAHEQVAVRATTDSDEAFGTT